MASQTQTDSSETLRVVVRPLTTASRSSRGENARSDQEGMAILLVEQNARLALKLARRGYVLETGTITLNADAEVLRNDPRVTSAYLGE